jgi:hypothetical protein
VKDLTVLLPNRPGALADVAEALGRAGVNVEGFCAFAVAGGGIANVLVQDDAPAKEALEAAGLAVRIEQPVVVVELEDRPGALGEIARKVAAAGVNLGFSYLATGHRLVMGAPLEDLDKARAALER